MPKLKVKTKSKTLAANKRERTRIRPSAACRDRLPKLRQCLFQLRHCFQELRFCLFYLSNESPITIAVERGSRFNVVQERVLYVVHFRFRGLDFLYAAHRSTSVTPFILIM